MNKQQFVSLIKNYQSIKKDDLALLIELRRKYPYSQPIHNLIAKASFDHKATNAKGKLAIAAWYATDRIILKELIENKLQPGVDTKAQRIATTGVIDSKPKAVPKLDLKPSSDEAAIIALRKEVIKNLKDLQVTKKHYLALFEEKYSGKATKAEAPDISTTVKTKPKAKTTKKGKAKKSSTKRTSAVKTTSPKPKTAKTAAASKVKVSPKKTTAKKTTSKKVEAKKTAVKQTTKATSKPAKNIKKATKAATSTKSKEKKKLKNDEKNLVQQIEQGKAKNPTKKQKEQGEIIDSFIEKEPQIIITDDQDGPANVDLSKDTQELKDDLISENLAIIMEKQNKTQRAIDIYRKLIWKFPEKKTYFAAKIKKLK